MKFILTLLFLLLSTASFAHDERFSLSSEKLGEDITVQVSLPDSYHHSNDFSYPLLVVLDGSTQFSHVASAVHFYSTYAVIPEMIVVGISTQNRLAYFTHTEPEAFAGRAGRASLLTDVLQNELLTTLNKKFRVAPYHVIAGHSLSGLYTSHLAVSRHSAFNAAISISPSLWWDDAVIVSEYQSQHLTKTAKPFRWFLSMATEPNEMPEAFNNMLSALNTHSTAGLYYSYARFPDETHDSTPLVGMAKGLKAVFSGWNAVPEIDVMPLTELTKFYEGKAKEFGYTFPMSVHQYNVYGLKAAYEGKVEWGIEILAQGTKAFPDSEILWDSLATAHSFNKNGHAALEASERAMALAVTHNSIFMNEIKAQNNQIKAKQQNIAK